MEERNAYDTRIDTQNRQQVTVVPFPSPAKLDGVLYEGR